MKKIFDPEIEAKFPAEISKAKSEYNYQPKLTKKLDAHQGEFTEHTLLEIVLWKTNRYPDISQEIIVAINELRSEYTENRARNLLNILLDKESKGFDLPMASTVLRFACPEHFQIIDQRVYRFITPNEMKLKLPFNKQKKIELYFDYIKRLKEVCNRHQIDFKESDRILYQLDKIYNKDLPIH